MLYFSPIDTFGKLPILNPSSDSNLGKDEEKWNPQPPKLQCPVSVAKKTRHVDKTLILEVIQVGYYGFGAGGVRRFVFLQFWWRIMDCCGLFAKFITGTKRDGRLCAGLGVGLKPRLSKYWELFYLKGGIWEVSPKISTLFWVQNLMQTLILLLNMT